MATLKRALESDPRVRVRANAVTALDALPTMALFGQSVFDQNRRDIRRYLLRVLDDDTPPVQPRAGACSRCMISTTTVRATRCTSTSRSDAPRSRTRTSEPSNDRR